MDSGAHCACPLHYADGPRMASGKDILAPAVNLLNENPSLVALGKLTHTNPRATHEPTNPQTSLAQPSPAQPSPSPTQRTNPRTYEPKQPSPAHHHSSSAPLSQIPLYHIPRWFACSVYCKGIVSRAIGCSLHTMIYIHVPFVSLLRKILCPTCLQRRFYPV